MNFWLCLAGYGYAVIGILFVFTTAVILMRHLDKCDNCIFGTEWPFENFASANLSSKAIVIISYFSVVTWPLTVLMLIAIFIAFKFEKWFAKPVDLKLQSLVRAWLKRNKKPYWTTQIGSGGDYVEHYFIGKSIAAKVVIEKNVRLLLLDRYGAYDDKPIQETHLSAADPLLFKKIKDFINNVSKTYEH